MAPVPQGYTSEPSPLYRFSSSAPESGLPRHVQNRIDALQLLAAGRREDDSATPEPGSNPKRSISRAAIPRGTNPASPRPARFHSQNRGLAIRRRGSCLLSDSAASSSV